METTVNEIEYIKEMLPVLSETDILELKDFMAYLLYKKKKRKAFEDRLDKIERESDTVGFDSVEEAMNAIRNWSE
jgi:hypothetical protein